MLDNRAGRGRRRAAFLIFLGVPALVFWRTAYPTITWWDSPNYSLAAATLGVTSPPGSLLLTLIGWPITRLPLGATPAHMLNLFAGVLGTVTIALVFVVSLRLLRLTSKTDDARVATATAIGAGIGALTFAFSDTLWEHSIKFTPYILSAVFTGLILLTLLRWWQDADQPNAWRWIALVTFLFGLDFSVHRTNALLIPGALAWILVRQPRTVVRMRPVVAAFGGLIAGLAVQLLVMPIAAATQSPLNMFEPTNWSRLWDYVSLSPAGGGFLVDFWPRNGAIWSVQLADFARVFSENFLHWSTPLWIIGCLPALAGLLGLILLYRRNRRLGLAIALLLALHASMTVLYFNIPANYFRPFDRHYLPVFVTFAVAMACGMGVVAQAAWRVAAMRWRFAPGVIAALLVSGPAAQVLGNWTAYDASRRYFARDYATNALQRLPPKAIYFTVGDNDTFPVLYMQAVEHVRPDVRIVNLSLANTSWYVQQFARRELTFPLTLKADDSRLQATQIDSLIRVRIRGAPAQLGLRLAPSVPDSITLRPKARVGTDIIPADVVLLDIVRSNEWRDPITFAVTAGEDGMGWLKPYARLEGLFWRIVPVDSVRLDREVLRENLLDRFEYRGFADPSVTIEEFSRVIGRLYVNSFRELLQEEAASGNSARCSGVAARLFALLPPDRLELSPRERPEIEALCRSAIAGSGK